MAGPAACALRVHTLYDKTFGLRADRLILFHMVWVVGQLVHWAQAGFFSKPNVGNNWKSKF
jgi:hypothetical protein